VPKISQFPSGGVAQNTDLIPVVRNGGDYTITGYNLAALASYGQAYTGTFTATAGQTVFTLPASPGSLANLAISVDGAVMVPGTDYTWTTPTTLTFMTGLSAGQTVLYRYTTSVPVGTAIAGGVNGQLLYNNSGIVNGTTIGGDASLVASTGALTVTKTNGVAFAASATTNTTVTGNITYTQGGTGSTSRTVTAKLQESVSVKDFGAVGDGSTDDTTAIQNAINALGQLITSNPYANSNIVSTVGGGILYFPKGKYKVTNTLLYSGGMIWQGDDLGTAIVFTPSSSINCVSPNTSAYTWGTTIEQFTIRNMYFAAANSNAATGLYLANTNAIHLDKVRVDGFNTYGIYIGQSVASSSYCNVLIDVEVWNCPTNLYLDTLANNTTIVGGLFTHKTGFSTCNYNVINKAGGVTFVGTDFEGKAKLAQLNDQGIGTRLVNVYYEDAGYTSGVPLVTKDYSVGLSGNTSVEQSRKGAIQLSNFPETGADSDSYEQFMPMTAQRGFPKYVTGLISNGNFNYGLRDWFRYNSGGSYAHGTAYLDSSTYLGKASLRLVHDGSGINSYMGVAQTIPNRMFAQYVGNGTRVYIHVLVKFENEADSYIQLNMNGAGISNKWSAYRSMSYGSGIYLYTCNTPILTAADLSFVVQCGSTTAGRQFWVYGAWATIGGMDLLGCPTQDLFTDTASPSTTAYATWPVGATVYNGTYASGQAFGWICKTAGTNGPALSGITANTTSGSTAVTFSDVTNLGVGMYITIAGVTGTKRIATLSGTSGTLDSNASATVTGGAVAYSNATFGALFTP